MKLEDKAVNAAHAQRRAFFIHRNFALLWIGQSISEFGSWITESGLALAAVLLLHATPFETGLLAALGGLPILVIGLFAGMWIDRLPRRPILILADYGRAALLLSIPIAALMGRLHIVQLYIVTLLVGILTAIFTIAYRAYLPHIVAQEQLVEANSKLGTSSALAEIGGPALSGMLIQALTMPFAIVFDALSFVCSALCTGGIRAPEAEITREQHEGWLEIAAGLKLLIHNPILRAITIRAAMRTFFGGTFAALYTIYTVRILGASPTLFGILVTLGGVGALVGSIGANWLTRRFGIGKTMLIGLIVSGGLMACIPLAGTLRPIGFGLLMASQLIGDCGEVVYQINEISLQQRIIPEQMLGRVLACQQALVNGIGPLGALVAGLSSMLIDVQITLWIGAVGVLCSTAWIFFSPIRQL